MDTNDKKGNTIKAEKRISYDAFQVIILLFGLLWMAWGVWILIKGYHTYITATSWLSLAEYDWADAKFGGGLCISIGALVHFILFMVNNRAVAFFDQLEQTLIQQEAQIDIDIEERVILLESLAKHVDKGTEQELNLMLQTARIRSGGDPNLERSNVCNELSRFVCMVEAYPTYHSNELVLKLMKEDSECMKRITRSKSSYNNTVNKWNTALFEWPIKGFISAEAELWTKEPLRITGNIMNTND